MSPSTDLRDRPSRAIRVEPAIVDLRSGGGALDLTTLDRSRIGPATPQPPVDPVPDHVVALDVAALEDASRLADRWLTGIERAAADRRGERGRASHIAGRVAAKQAVISHLTARGFDGVSPERIEITNDEHGCPTVRVRGARVAARHVRVSIAHTASVAVAVATGRRAPRSARTAGADDAIVGPGIGIDVEVVEPRSDRFERLTLTVAERRLDPVPGDDRDTWLTRLWSAKEAAAKATGRGLGGRPKAFEATLVDGERIRVDGRWILTELVAFAGGRQVVAATADHRTECTWHRS